MTFKPAIGLPLASLLAPQSPAGPPDLLPSPSAAVLGPLPPTTPLHLALNWLALSDLPEYESAISDLGHPSHQNLSSTVTEDPDNENKAEEGIEGKKTKRKRLRKERVLILTGRKDDYYQSLQDEDEDWMRDHGSDYDVVSRLKRVDMRYCPTPDHLLLILSLITRKEDSGTTIRDNNHKAGSVEDTYSLDTLPGLIILWDIAGLFMEWEGGDENGNPEENDLDMMDSSDQKLGPVKKFKKVVKLSDYLDIVSATKSMVNHISETRPTLPAAQLVLLEPSLDRSSSLPVLPQLPKEGESSTSMPIGIRQKRIKVLDGLKWILGQDAIGIISPYVEDAYDPSFQLILLSNPDLAYHIKRRRCGRGEWARVMSADEETEGDRGGWRWEWC